MSESPPLQIRCNAAELTTLAGALHGVGIQLELLTRPMTGTYDPAGMGSMLFAVCVVAAKLDRDCIRALREAGTPMPKIARTVTINTGKNAGRHPSVASLYRALAEAGPVA